MTKRDFLFIDEFGDTGQIQSTSADYFGLSVLHVNESGIADLESHFSKFRYFGCMRKELKHAYNKHQKHIIEDIFNEIEENCDVNCSLGFFIKRKYKGPYLKDDSYDSSKLRNFTIRRVLEEHFAKFPPESESVELIFDRYNTQKEYTENLLEYLNGNYNLPNFTEIVQIDSLCCTPIQLSDLFVRVVKEKTNAFQDLKKAPSFCEIFCLN